MLVQPPSFAGYVRHLREGHCPAAFAPTPDPPRGLVSRADLAARAELSMGYVTKLEQGYAARPSTEVVERICDALGVNAAERDHLNALSDPPEPDTAASPGAQQITDLQRETAEALNPHLVAYVSETWDVLYANEEYARLFRHIAHPRVGNVLRWFFLVPESRKIMSEWEPEARLTVAWLRALMARRRSPMFGDLLDELYQEPEFRRMWELREVILGRHQPHFHLYDLDRGQDVSLLTQVYPTPDPAQAVMMYLGTRVDLSQDSGPAS